MIFFALITVLAGYCGNGLLAHVHVVAFTQSRLLSFVVRVELDVGDDSGNDVLCGEAVSFNLKLKMFLDGVWRIVQQDKRLDLFSDGSLHPLFIARDHQPPL